MSSTVQILLKDDIDGSPADQTILFAFDSITYEIDLSQRNVIALRQALSKYIKAARPVRGAASQLSVRANGRGTAKSSAKGRSTNRASSRGPVRGKSAGSNRPSARVRSASGTGANPAAVREWARRQGIAVSQRGRISADVVAKFQGSHKVSA